jgi:hypothetical protein
VKKPWLGVALPCQVKKRGATVHNVVNLGGLTAYLLSRKDTTKKHTVP